MAAVRISRAGVTLLVALVSPGVLSPRVAAEDAEAPPRLRIEVSPEQVATITGQSSSVRLAVEELCWRAQVALRAYDARDRPVAADYAKRPLHEVLAGLLREESYVLGVGPGPGSAPGRVLWLRVLGDSERARTRRTREGTHTESLGSLVPPGLLRTAFGSDAPAAREAALRVITARVLGNPTGTRALLATAPEVIAEAVGRYPWSRELLGRVRDSSDDPAVRAHLTQVLARLPR